MYSLYPVALDELPCSPDKSDPLALIQDLRPPMSISWPSAVSLLAVGCWAPRSLSVCKPKDRSRSRLVQLNRFVLSF